MLQIEGKEVRIVEEDLREAVRIAQRYRETVGDEDSILLLKVLSEVARLLEVEVE